MPWKQLQLLSVKCISNICAYFKENSVYWFHFSHMTFVTNVGQIRFSVSAQPPNIFLLVLEGAGHCDTSFHFLFYKLEKTDESLRSRTTIYAKIWLMEVKKKKE